jgi:hypothetical protein
VVGKPKRKKPRRRPRGRREDNITMDLIEMWWGVDYIELARIRISGRLL